MERRVREKAQRLEVLELCAQRVRSPSLVWTKRLELTSKQRNDRVEEGVEPVCSHRDRGLAERVRQSRSEIRVLRPRGDRHDAALSDGLRGDVFEERPRGLTQAEPGPNALGHCIRCDELR